MCSVKKVSLKISQNSQENTCARDSFFNKVQASACNTFFYRTPLVAASAENIRVAGWLLFQNSDTIWHRIFEIKAFNQKIKNVRACFMP